MTADNAQRNLAIVVGEFNGVDQSSTGYTLKIKHMADLPLHIDTQTWQKAARSYSSTLEAVCADVEQKPRVLMALLICARREHFYEVDSLTCMLVSRQWLPLEGTHELPLIEALQQEGRKFIKPLRYDLGCSAALASVLLLDCADAPCPMHVISPFLNPRDRTVQEHVVAELGDRRWVWHTDQPMPAFPRQLNRTLARAATVRDGVEELGARHDEERQFALHGIGTGTGDGGRRRQ